MPNVLFGERLRTLRKRKGLTQEAVAQRLSIHRTAYTKYETSGVTPDPQGLVTLAELFGVSVDYLVGRDTTPVSVTEQEGGGPEMTLMEQQLLQMFRQLSYPEQQELLHKAQQTLRQRKKR